MSTSCQLEYINHANINQPILFPRSPSPTAILKRAEGLAITARRGDEPIMPSFSLQVAILTPTPDGGDMLTVTGAGLAQCLVIPNLTEHSGKWKLSSQSSDILINNFSLDMTYSSFYPSAFIFLWSWISSCVLICSFLTMGFLHLPCLLLRTI